MCDVIRSIWIFCPQMPPRDIPKMSQIGVNRLNSPADAVMTGGGFDEIVGWAG